MNSIPGIDSINQPQASKQARLSRLRTGLGLFGAPAAWVAQFALSEPLVAHACFPFQTPLSAPIWDGLPSLLAYISMACLLAALLSGFAAWTLWRQTGRKPAGSVEGGLGSNEGRTLFLAKLGLMSSFIFIAAILFNICAELLVPLCSSWF